MPIGFKILLITGIIGTVLQIIHLFNGQYLRTYYFGLQLPSNINFLLAVFYIILSITNAISIINRYRWGWTLFVVSSLFGYVTFFITSYNLLFNNATFTLPIVRSSLIIIDIIFLCIALPITWYVYKNKGYYNK